MATFKNITKNITTSRVMIGYSQDFNLNDTLDSALIYISNVSNDSLVEDYDLIKFTDERGTEFYYQVAQYTKSYNTFTKPYTYNYQISLMSLNKLLEGIVVPARTVTNIGQASAKTIKSFIEMNANRYFKSDSGYGLVSIECPDTTSKCPELSLPKQTLRERLDSLYELSGCISVLTFSETEGGFVLKYLDLSGHKAEINTKYLDDARYSETASDYVNKFDTDIDSAIGNKTITDNKQFESNEYCFDSKNAKIVLSHKIYDFSRLLCSGFTVAYKMQKDVVNSDGTTTTTTIEDKVAINQLDISEYVVPKEVYDSLETVEVGKFTNASIYTSTVTGNVENFVLTNVKNNTLYYSRGGNTLDNFHTYQSGRWDTFWQNDFTAFESAVLCELAKHINYLRSDFVNSDDTTYTLLNIYVYDYEDEYSNVYFSITYTPYQATKLVYEKDNPLNHDIAMINNQTNTTVDFDKLGKQMTERLNQTGNESLSFTAHISRADGNTDEIEIGQTFNDYVVTQVEKISGNEVDQYKGVMNKYYTNRNIYTMIDRSKRYYALADNSESLIRHEYISTKVQLNVGTSDITTTCPLVGNDCTYAWFRTEKSGGTFIAQGYMIPTSVIKPYGIVYTVEFMNNAAYGIKRSDETVDDTSYQLMQYCKYVDDNGECVIMKIWLYDSRDTSVSMKNFVADFPSVSLNTKGNQMLVGVTDKSFNKDNREQVFYSLECKFTTANEKVVLSRNIAQLIGVSGVRVVESDTEFTKDNIDDFSIGSKSYTLIVLKGDTDANGLIKFSGTEGKNLIFLTTDNVPLFAINNITSDDKTVYFTLPEASSNIVTRN